MTGNVVFLGFGIAGAGGISIWASLAALGSFLVGSVGGGRIGTRWSSDRGRHLTATTATELLLVACALVVAAFSTHHIGTGSRYAVIVLLAVAMGVQNAAARKLAVPDLTTTVLTMTLTGVAADSALAGGPGSRLASSRTLRRRDAARRVHRRSARLEGRQPRATRPGDRVVGGHLLRRLPRIAIDARVDTRRQRTLKRVTRRPARALEGSRVPRAVRVDDQQSRSRRSPPPPRRSRSSSISCADPRPGVCVRELARRPVRPRGPLQPGFDW